MGFSCSNPRVHHTATHHTCTHSTRARTHGSILAHPSGGSSGLRPCTSRAELVLVGVVQDKAGILARRGAAVFKGVPAGVGTHCAERVLGLRGVEQLFPAMTRHTHSMEGSHRMASGDMRDTQARRAHTTSIPIVVHPPPLRYAVGWGGCPTPDHHLDLEVLPEHAALPVPAVGAGVLGPGHLASTPVA